MNSAIRIAVVRPNIRCEGVAAVDRAPVRARLGEARGRLETARLVGANPQAAVIRPHRRGPDLLVV